MAHLPGGKSTIQPHLESQQAPYPIGWDDQESMFAHARSKSTLSAARNDNQAGHYRKERGPPSMASLPVSELDPQGQGSFFNQNQRRSLRKSSGRDQKDNDYQLPKLKRIFA